MSTPTECSTCGGPAVCWADNSDGLTVNFRCPNARCKAGKGPWDTPEPVEVRAAIIRGGDRERVAAYLPRGYEVCTEVSDGVLIAGRDEAGWTLEDYVLPRLASGLMFGNECAVIWCDECDDEPVWACGDLCEACEARQGSETFERALWRATDPNLPRRPNLGGSAYSARDVTCQVCGHRLASPADLDAHAPCPEGR